MNKFKKVATMILFIAVMSVLIGCDSNHSRMTEDELREALEGRWEFWEPTEIGLLLTTLNFTDSWRDEEDVIGPDVALTIGGLTGEPNIHFLYMRVYTNHEPPLVTIYGYSDEHGEVEIFDEAPVTIAGDVLRIGDHTFYAADSEALEEHIVDVLTGDGE